MNKKKISICKGSHEIPLIKKTISSILHESAKVCPNQKAIISHIEGKTYTYKELNSEVNLACRSLISFCLLYTSPSPRDRTRSRMPSSA